MGKFSVIFLQNVLWPLTGVKNGPFPDSFSLIQTLIQFYIANKSENPVNLTNIQTKNGAITVYTPLPVQIPPGQTLLLDIGVNGVIPQNGIQLDANFDPCGSGNSITIILASFKYFFSKSIIVLYSWPSISNFKI